MVPKLVTLALTGSLAWIGSGCGYEFQDTRCNDIVDKLYACDPEVATTFECSSEALKNHAEILSMSCHSVGAKADGTESDLWEMMHARREKGHLNLQDLEDLFLATGKWYSLEEDRFFKELIEEIFNGGILYKHVPLKDFIVIDCILETRQLAVPQPDAAGELTDTKLGWIMARRMDLFHAIGPRW